MGSGPASGTLWPVDVGWDGPAPPAGGQWQWPISSPWGPGLIFLLTAASYAAGSQLALLLIEESGLAGVFFIPAGITVAFLLRVPRRSWWLVLAAAAMAEAAMDLLAGIDPGQTLGFVAANTLEPVVGALIVSRMCGIVDLARLRHVFWFLTGAVLIGPVVGAGVGAAADRLLGGDDFITTFWQWWLGDALGVVLVGSAILVWGSSPDRRSLGSGWGGGLLGGTVLVTIVVFNFTDLPLMFLVLIGVVVAGAVFGVRAVSMTALLVALIAALELAFGSGRLVIGLVEASALIVIKLQLGVFAIAGLVVAAEANERQLATTLAVEADTRARLSEAERRMEHQIAVRLQEALLPSHPLQHPKVTVAARYEAGSEAMVVGGDWYDVFDLPGGLVGLTVGDVVGHGLEATAAMGRLRTAVAALAQRTESPGQLLSYLDHFASGPNGTEFATAAYAILDPNTGRLRFASAGHPPMLLVTDRGDTNWLLEGRSPPFHREPWDERPEASVTLDPGTMLIVYSDGLVERRGEDLDMGMSRLEEAARHMIDRSPHEMCDSLVRAMGVDSSRGDDVVVVVLRLERRGMPVRPIPVAESGRDAASVEGTPAFAAPHGDPTSGEL